MRYNEFIILRARDMSLRGSTTTARMVTVDVEELNGTDLGYARRDPSVFGLARTMPIRLVEPAARSQDAVSAPDDMESGGTAWGVEAVGACASPYTGDDVTVAVLDTGIDATHEAFSGVELIEKDFTGDGNGDSNGHGTHCAGTIFGRPLNGPRIGIAVGVRRALIAKVLGSKGGNSSKTVVEAIQWAVSEGANVISMSLGLDFPRYVAWLTEHEEHPLDFATSLALQEYANTTRLFDSLVLSVESLSAFTGEGTLIIAASGNESKRHISPDYRIAVSPPANATGVVSVGALKRLQPDGTGLAVADFSNTGPSIAAPGVAILSARADGGYSEMSGTSMAAPHVAGVAALWAEKLLREDGRIRSRTLYSKVVGQAEKEPLSKSVDVADIGAGLVRAPLR